MAIFAEFYTRGVISGELIPACGDRSVIQLDGRYSRENQLDIAKYWCEKRGYLAYRLIRGNSLLNAKPVTDLREI